jgi:3-oxoacyl-(acyl-carrier-protein) synthase
VQRGAADLGFAGSAESKLNPMGLIRMELCGRIAPTGAGAMTPREVVRPFSKATLGGLIGEAGGIVIIEDEAQAKARGARAHARVLGFGAAHSMVVPLPNALASDATPDEAVKGSGRGLALAMRSAIRDAGLEPEQIDAVVPEGSGVRFVDRAEAWALREVFGTRADAMPLVCVSPIIGGCAAGNGGVQAVVGALVLARGKLPEGVTVTLDGRSWEKEPGSVNSTGKLRRILLCSMGLSGQNAAIVLEAV